MFNEKLKAFSDYIGIENVLTYREENSNVYIGTTWSCTFLPTGKTCSRIIGLDDLNYLVYGNRQKAIAAYDLLENTIESILDADLDFLSTMSILKVGL